VIDYAEPNGNYVKIVSKGNVKENSADKLKSMFYELRQ